MCFLVPVCCSLRPWVAVGYKPTDQLPLAQANAHLTSRRRALADDVRTRISCHSFRATGITTYLQKSGKLEVAQRIAGDGSARTTGLYDRRNDSVALDEVERVVYSVEMNGSRSARRHSRTNKCRC